MVSAPVFEDNGYFYGLLQGVGDAAASIPVACRVSHRAAVVFTKSEVL